MEEVRVFPRGNDRGEREDGEGVQAAYYEKEDCSLHQDKILYNGRRV